MGPFPTFLVFHVVRPVATVRVQVEPDPEPTLEFGTVADTTHANFPQNLPTPGDTTQSKRQRSFDSPQPKNWLPSLGI